MRRANRIASNYPARYRDELLSAGYLSIARGRTTSAQIRSAMIDDMRRASGWRQTVATHSVGLYPHAASTQPGPDAEAQWAELIERVGDLPPRQADVMLLLFQDGLNQREAGERIGITASRVAQIKAQALATMRAANP